MNTTVKQIIAALLKADDISSSGIIDNYVIYPQTWASTTLGFGGVGGNMMTTAPTIAIETKGIVFVFFSERDWHILKKYQNCLKDFMQEYLIYMLLRLSKSFYNW